MSRAVITRVGTSARSSASCSASELITVANIPMKSLCTRSMPWLAPRSRRCCRRRRRCRAAHRWHAPHPASSAVALGVWASMPKPPSFPHNACLNDDHTTIKELRGFLWHDTRFYSSRTSRLQSSTCADAPRGSNYRKRCSEQFHRRSS